MTPSPTDLSAKILAIPFELPYGEDMYGGYGRGFYAALCKAAELVAEHVADGPGWHKTTPSRGTYISKTDWLTACCFEEGDLDRDGSLLYGPIPAPPAAKEGE